jgi:hypothetical protein
MKTDDRRARTVACVASLAIFFLGTTPRAGGLKLPKVPRIKWDPVKDLTGKNLNQAVKDRLQNFGNQTEDFAKNPVQYTLDPGQRVNRRIHEHQRR